MEIYVFLVSFVIYISITTYQPAESLFIDKSKSKSKKTPLFPLPSRAKEGFMKLSLSNGFCTTKADKIK